MPSAEQLVHLGKGCANLRPQLFGKFDQCAAPRLSIKQRASRNLAAEHFFYAHCLGAELGGVEVPFLGLSPFVLHGKGPPLSLKSSKSHAVAGAVELQHIAFAGNAETPGVNFHAASDKNVSAPFRPYFAVHPLVKQLAADGV
jgi:hypothetical protein